MPDATSLQLALLLGRRAAYLFKTSTDPDVVAERIAASGVDRAKADALAWSGSADLSPTEIDALAANFCLHRDLLASLFRPVSAEVLASILKEVEDYHLDSPLNCDECEEFGDRIDVALGNGCVGDHSSLIFDLLGHLRVTINSALEISPFEESSPLFADSDAPNLSPPVSTGPAPTPSWLLPSVEDEEFDQLAFIFSSLDPAARARVLAFAYNEKAEALAGRPLGTFAAFARLRSDFLTLQARKALDAIASSPGGEMSLQELVHTLGLEDGRALGQLERSVKASVEALSAAGYHLPDHPLEVIRARPGSSRLRLTPEALRAWQSLLSADAERESGGSGARSHAES